MSASFLEHLEDRRRICVLLRASGFSYSEIAEWIDVNERVVRHEFEGVLRDFDGQLDLEDGLGKNGRLMRLIYLLGYTDGAGMNDSEENYDAIQSLIERAAWLRMRIRNREQMITRIGTDG